MIRLPRGSSAALLVSLLASGCLSTTVPEARSALQATAIRSPADVAAYEEADAADDRLNDWCAAALAIREAGEPLAADDPVLGEEAAAAVERIRQSAAAAESEELRVVLVALADAHQRRLDLLGSPGKHAPKKYLRAERDVVELGFGLRRWRRQR
ncbi:MAG: hypothetical protein OEP45_10250 [Acidobacteriota bacterium]|nr:hypothetical protein [Acidobacteriota bacterium]